MFFYLTICFGILLLLMLKYPHCDNLSAAFFLATSIFMICTAISYPQSHLYLGRWFTLSPMLAIDNWFYGSLILFTLNYFIGLYRGKPYTSLAVIAVIIFLDLNIYYSLFISVLMIIISFKRLLRGTSNL